MGSVFFNTFFKKNQLNQFKKENKHKMIERIRPELKLKFLKEAQKVGHCPDIFSIVRVTSSQPKYVTC